MVRDYCYYHYHALEKKLETIYDCYKNSNMASFLFNARGASCFVKAGKKNNMLPDLRTSLVLSFYIPCSIPCLSFTAAIML